ncbi:DUF1707 SHOCT-like domain-containing protein [Actinokineospora alba]|uniref:DUF1707 SHOCT-like domain-containing protein n=1 Tax=Actinokineospora alba TaxID=504798 RepID=UPI000AF6FC6C|nr:DUF1707 domain-containing protein [Actinokineospora alba]TDP66093.1 uncharacterized protein DUF1707 [Actinokineospora alba]
MTTPISPRELRVSDAERSHVVGVLQKAIGHGLLSLDEFTARTDVALAARTRAELNTVLVDLPGLVHPESGVAPVKPVEFRATMSALKREGEWVVPRDMVIRSQMGSTVLDFSDAVISFPEIRIEVDVAAGSVELLMPERSSVDASAVTVELGSKTDKASGSRAGGPHFVVTGSVRAGSLTIRRPTYVRIGSLTIRRPWRISWDA